jgi:hypothetical protein
MSETENIKSRVRKLMALANDGQASDGEIENAMRAAAKLADRYHLDLDSLTTDQVEDAEQRMAQSNGLTRSSKFHQWETTLAWAIVELFGSIKHYLPNKKVPFRVNGVAQTHGGRYEGKMKMRRQVTFYGPVHEVEEAAELFTEWCELIQTMGVVRWGGAFRGEGEAYCQGFADKLKEIASAENQKRKLTPARAPLSLSGETSTSKEITLQERHLVLRQRAEHWLEHEQGVKLGKGPGRQGSSAAGGEAYLEGVRHASGAGFGRTVQRKRLPGA